MSILISIIVSLLVVGCWGDTEDSPVAKAFIDNKLVPDIVDVAPKDYINVNYSDVVVDLGNEVNPVQTLLQPTVNYAANADQLYTLMFFGPDLPIDLTPNYTQFLHWLIVNIPGENIDAGDTVSTYFPPVPYPGGFPYLFLLFEQNGRIDSDTSDLSSLLERPHFDVLKFKNDHNLTGPIAGNFMREAYVAPLIESLFSSITK